VIEEGGNDVAKEWQALFKEHEPLQVAQMTLETLGSYIRKDHKLDQQVYHAIKIPYLR
jgi:hypothetical protein